MRLYYERYLICDKCKQSERQTTLSMTLDWIGKSINGMFIKEFAEEHKDCNSFIRFTKWKVGDCNFNNKCRG